MASAHLLTGMSARERRNLGMTDPSQPLMWNTRSDAKVNQQERERQYAAKAWAMDTETDPTVEKPKRPKVERAKPLGPPKEVVVQERVVHLEEEERAELLQQIAALKAENKSLKAQLREMRNLKV